MRYEPKNVKSTILMVVVVLALILATQYFGIGTTRSAMQLAYIGNDASQREWSAGYLLLNGSLEHTIHPESDSNELSIEVETTSGTLSMVIKDIEENIVCNTKQIVPCGFTRYDD